MVHYFKIGESKSFSFDLHFFYLLGTLFKLLDGYFNIPVKLYFNVNFFMELRSRLS